MAPSLSNEDNLEKLSGDITKRNTTTTHFDLHKF